MTGDVWDYNSLYIKIMSGEIRKIIFFRSDEEYQECLEIENHCNGLKSMV